MTRDEKRGEARRLRAEGKSNGEIGRALGVDRRRIGEWLSARPCVSCGVDVSSHRVEHCPRCAADAKTIWTRDAILLAIEEWAHQYGEPPASADWNPYQCRHELHDEERARCFEDADGAWPGFMTVVGAFGSWNAALAAAGFASRAPHGGDGNELRQRRFHRKAAA